MEWLIFVLMIMFLGFGALYLVYYIIPGAMWDYAINLFFPDDESYKED